ncbi:ketopantoate reductase family protein [Alteromonas sp. ASW11-130]|uniref:ketopantoate reductase family protein n=1 Tax=Alteromonas sp. ASW11-130 TaxID=3015775 RepID=UPI0022423D39|nr:2-dehydropantoate 2-reductase [Alteromonas sp. ASW11-130]MCW8093124.1 2-dehydropantoate 2-reductase [Alteromonas sp. ASW11-130]
MSIPNSFEYVQVIGDGAIGSLVCAGLESAKQHYGRSIRSSPQVTLVKTYGGENIRLKEACTKRLKLGQRDLLLLPLKVYQLEPALNEWQKSLHPETTIMLLQNGMGGESLAKKLLPDNPLILASTSHGALKADTTVTHTGVGITKVGSNNIKGDSWQARSAVYLIQRCLNPAYWEVNINQALWFKLAVNAVINPLTALNNIPNGELAQPRFHERIALICNEISHVMLSEDIKVSSTELIENCLTVAKATATNYSSMHQDVLHKRKTEIDSINGFVVEVAKKKGIDVPINTQLVEQIKAL